MVHDPSVMVLDEPAAGLDPRARIELRTMIRALAAEGKSILISSHILTELAEICDSVGIIEHGHLLARGTVAEIRGQRETSEVHVRVLERDAELVAWLNNHAHVAEVRSEDGRHVFGNRGGKKQQADLLRAMVEAGFRVIEFGTETHSLEDIFMNVTKGRLQ